MATTYNDNGGATPNGSNLNFTYTFPIFKTEDVKVALNGVTQATTKYSVNTGVNPTRIEFNNTSVDATVQESSGAPKTGVTVRVYRDTDVDTAKAVYAAGSSIRSQNLNDNHEQFLYHAQEQQNQLILAEHIQDGAITSAKILDGTIVNADVNSSAAIAQAKLNIADATTSASGYMSGADKTKLDAIETAATGDQTAAEIKTLVGSASDSNVFTDADHSKLDGIASGAEVNVKSDWNASSGDEEILNKPTIPELIDEDDFSSDSATKSPSQQSTKAYIAATSQPLDADLTTLAGMQAGTASILASGTALTSTTAELNLLDGKSFVTAVSGSSTDVQIPSAKAVNDQIVSTLQNVGGFYPIDDELKFPNTNPDPNDDAGTIVSIADAGGIVVNGSGVSTTGRTLGGATVTINGIDSSLNSTTIAAGKGMLVQTTSTLNTYTYHRLIVDEAGVASAQTLVSDFNDRYQIASSAPSNHPDGSALADGDLWFNTSTNTMMVYDLGNTSYAAVTSVGDYKLLTLEDTDGSAADFTNSSFNLKDGGSAANVTSAGQLIISVNGVIQKPNAGTSAPAEGFALVDSDTIIFSNAPGSGASVFVTAIGTATTVNVPATNSVSTSTIQNLAVGSAQIAADAVITAKIANDAVDGTKIADNAINSEHYTDGSIDHEHLAADCVDGDNIQDDVINSEHLAAGGIDLEHMSSESVDEDNLYISNAGSDGQYLQKQSGNDGGLTWATPAQYTTPLTTRGDILYRAASADARLAKGTAGQFLKIGANDPEWSDVSAGAVGGSTDKIFWENGTTVTTNYTIGTEFGAACNAISAGPITINNGVTVTVDAGDTWTIV